MAEFTVFLNDQLSNEEYHAETEHISGSSLAKIFQSCPAKWRWDESNVDEAKKSEALRFGTLTHANVLEPETFNAKFARMPSQADFDKNNLITSVAGLQSWLKERGIPGRSKSDPFELIALIKNCCSVSGEDVPLFWHEIYKIADDAAGDRFKAKAEDYDRCIRMREVLFNNPQYHKVIMDGVSEISIFGTLWGCKVKVRLDKVTKDAEIWDYKTCDSANPERFTRRAFDLGYPLKMALQYWLFKGAYGRAPHRVILLAQEKEPPFLPLEFALTEKTLKIGTAQLREAIAQFQYSTENNLWPGYNGGQSYPMDPPFYIERQYSHLFEDLK